MEISVHDNTLHSYCVSADKKEICIHTSYALPTSQQFSDIIFTGVVAYRFELDNFMTTTLDNYVNVNEKIADSGCIFPSEIGIIFLPENFDIATSRSAFGMRSEAATAKTLFRNNNIPVGQILPNNDRMSYIRNNGFEWALPILFISASLISQNPSLMSLVLGELTNYLSDLFKGMTGEKIATLKIVVEKKAGSSCKKITYKGDVGGLKSLAEINTGL